MLGRVCITALPGAKKVVNATNIDTFLHDGDPGLVTRKVGYFSLFFYLTEHGPAGPGVQPQDRDGQPVA